MRRTARRARWAMAVLVWTGAALAAPSPTPGPDAFERIHQATVTLEDGRCAGVIVRDERHALTAAHCVREGEARLSLTLFDGTEISAAVERVDRDSDLAILTLEAAAPVEPLLVASRLPEIGATLLFSGRNDRGSSQVARLERLGRCPSLPKVPNALFTSIDGQKGDSGAPVVDLRGEVVGLVHGGAKCGIAAPTAGVGPELELVAAASGGRRVHGRAAQKRGQATFSEPPRDRRLKK